jgi:hypothetical protein
MAGAKGSKPSTAKVKPQKQKGLPDVSDGGAQRTVPAPPRWQESERTSRVWREQHPNDKISTDKAE